MCTECRPYSFGIDITTVNVVVRKCLDNFDATALVGWIYCGPVFFLHRLDCILVLQELVLINRHLFNFYAVDCKGRLLVVSVYKSKALIMLLLKFNLSSTANISKALPERLLRRHLYRRLPSIMFLSQQMSR